MIFKDRIDAANKLTTKLEGIRKENLIILAIPRGGVVIGDILAKTLGATLDIVISRKIGSPNNPELAIGAVMHDGSFFPNSSLIDALGVQNDYLDEQIIDQLNEIQRRLKKFRSNANYDLKDRTVVLVDDGIATGATVFVALEWIKKQKPKRIIVAIPVGPKDTIDRLRRVVEVVVLHDPVSFGAVGEFYDSFDQVEDNEVVEILSRHHKLNDAV